MTLQQQLNKIQSNLQRKIQMAKNIQIIIIDPQNSFCKVVDPAVQQSLHDGELCVPGAWDDMVRIAKMITRLGDKIDDISVTLDSHHQFHIAHTPWFRNIRTNRMPDPFTRMREENGRIINYIMQNGQMVDIGECRTVTRDLSSRTIEYLRQLSLSGRYPHTMWTTHCLIGTTGHNIVAPLAEALFEWELKNTASFRKVTKGSNPFVEHFSAVRAEVIDPSDPTTALNTDFIKAVMVADEILLGGEARNFCLANTARDIANEFVSDNDSFIRKCILLTDGTSDVPGFDYGDVFMKEMLARGMRTTTTKDYLA